MQKVLHPGYFPVTACDVYPTSWKDFTLEQAMAAYWKVKSWSFSISGYSAGGSGGGSGSIDVIVDVDEMSDLVCSTSSSASGSGSGEVIALRGSVSPGGIFFGIDCFDEVFIYYSSIVGEFPGSQPVTIIIKDQTISTTAEAPVGVSATITITATDFFDIEN